MAEMFDYSTELKTFLFDNSGKKNESRERFEKRTDGHYFSESVIDFDYLAKELSKAGISDEFLQMIIFQGNALFMNTFNLEAKPKVSNIVKKIRSLSRHSDFQSTILWWLLLVFFLEKGYKSFPKYLSENVVKPLRPKINAHSKTLINSIHSLSTLFQTAKDFDPALSETFLIPVRDKAIALGLSEKMLQELQEYIQKIREELSTQIENQIKTDFSYKHAKEFTPFARDLMKNVRQLLRDFSIETPNIHLAELLDLFEIRPLNDIIEEHAEDEKMTRQDALRLSVKRTQDILNKQRK